MKIEELVAAIRSEAAKQLADAVVDKLDIEDIKVETNQYSSTLAVDLSVPETKLKVNIPISKVLRIEER